MVSVDPKAIRFLQAKPMVIEDTEAAETIVAKAETETPETTAENTESASEVQSEETSEPVSTPVKPKGPKRKPESGLTPFNLPEYASPFIFIPAYLEVSFPTCSTIYLRHPTARPGYSEVPTPFDADGEVIRLAWEWYSKVRPRMRSKSQLARMPENRQ
jgi:hypothetical protein